MNLQRTYRYNKNDNTPKCVYLYNIMVFLKKSLCIKFFFNVSRHQAINLTLRTMPVKNLIVAPFIVVVKNTLKNVMNSVNR